MFQLDNDLKYTESTTFNGTIELFTNTTKIINLTEDLNHWSSSSMISVNNCIYSSFYKITYNNNPLNVFHLITFRRFYVVPFLRCR